MRIENTSLKPKVSTFVKYFLLTLVSLFVLKAVLQFFAFPNTNNVNTLTWWFTLFLLSLGNAIGVTLGARKQQLTVADDDLNNARANALEYLSKTGLRIKESSDRRTTLEPIHRFNRLFNNWFGTEVVSVKQTDHALVIEGPVRHVELIDSTLRSISR